MLDNLVIDVRLQDLPAKRQQIRHANLQIGVWLAAVSLVTAVTVMDSFHWVRTIHPDLLIAQSAGRYLLTPHALHVYASHPQAQMGPGALLLSLLPRPVYLLLGGVLLAPVVLQLADAGLAIARQRWTWPKMLVAALAAGCCVVPWSQLVWKGHLDDALVLVGASMVLPSWTARPRWWRLAGIGIAALGKPTALILLGLTVSWELPMMLAAVLIFALVWAPFVLADPSAFLAAGGGVMPVAHGSLPAYLGCHLGGKAPAWIRIGQLGGGPAVAALLALRGRPAHALAAAFCLRALLDPNPAPAYSISIVVLALAVDCGRTIPWATALAAASFWLSEPVLHGGTGAYRLTVLAALLTALIWKGWQAAAPPNRTPPVARMLFDPYPAGHAGGLDAQLDIAGFPAEHQVPVRI